MDGIMPNARRIQVSARRLADAREVNASVPRYNLATDECEVPLVDQDGHHACDPLVSIRRFTGPNWLRGSGARQDETSLHLSASH